MEYRTLGPSGVRVSRLCLGTMMFGGPTDEAEARRIVDHALDHGVNFIDTANAYTGGNSERITGAAVRARRDRWVLATKVGNAVGEGANDRGLSRLHILGEIDRSLARLGLDHVDIYYVHRIDPHTPFEETALAFGEVIRAGKSRYWGISNLYAWQIAHVMHLSRELGVPAPIVSQPYYNLLNRGLEVEVIPACVHFGLAVVPYSPIARGVLTGKYKPGVAPEAGTRAARNDRRMMEVEWRPESLAAAERLKAHAARKGRGLVDFAVAWVLNNRAVASAIAGPRTFEQWTSYFSALDYPWDAEDEAAVDALVPPGHSSTPHYTDPKFPVEGRFPVHAATAPDASRQRPRAAE